LARSWRCPIVVTIVLTQAMSVMLVLDAV